MLVHKRDKRLLDNHQLLRGVIEQGVESVPLTPHANIVIIP